jgi:hypothetical protein
MPIGPHTPVPKPGDIPEVEAQTPKLRVLRFRFRRIAMKRWGMPKSPLELVFEEDQRGKKFYYAVRRETMAMKKGDFSEIYSVIIP